MGRFSEKIKIAYLTLVILFSLGVVVYLMDTWGVIRLEETFPFLKKEPPKIARSHDSPTLLERERLRKEKERLEELALKQKEEAKKLEEEKRELQKLKERLETVKKGLEEEKKNIAAVQRKERERLKLIERMAARLGSMPPEQAVALAIGWSNVDVVAVFEQMEKTARQAGRPSIVPFLLTRMPRERARVITALMMDSEAGRLPPQDR